MIVTPMYGPPPSDEFGDQCEENKPGQQFHWGKGPLQTSGTNNARYKTNE